MSFGSRGRTFPLTTPVAVLMEHRDRIQSGSLLELGPAHACVRTEGRLRRGDPIAITVSVPETTQGTTQALFRLISSVTRSRQSNGAGGDYVLVLEKEVGNLERAGELLGRFRKRGFLSS